MEVNEADTADLKERLSLLWRLEAADPLGYLDLCFVVEAIVRGSLSLLLSSMLSSLILRLPTASHINWLNFNYFYRRLHT
jgi:hypothetical protein